MAKKNQAFLLGNSGLITGCIINVKSQHNQKLGGFVFITIAGVASSTSAPQKRESLAAQLQALSLLTNFQDNKSGTSETSHNSHKWNGPGISSSSPPTSLPQGWMQLTDPENRVLYHNFLTGHTQYTTPASACSQPLADQQLASGSESDISNGLSSLGHRSGPLGQRLPSNESSGGLGQRLSGPASLTGHLSQRLTSLDSSSAGLCQQNTPLDASFNGLGHLASEYQMGRTQPL